MFERAQRSRNTRCVCGIYLKRRRQRQRTGEYPRLQKVGGVRCALFAIRVRRVPEIVGKSKSGLIVRRLDLITQQVLIGRSARHMFFLGLVCFVLSATVSGVKSPDRPE